MNKSEWLEKPGLDHGLEIALDILGVDDEKNNVYCLGTRLAQGRVNTDSSRADVYI